jgi:hypothetical protein
VLTHNERNLFKMLLELTLTVVALRKSVAVLTTSEPDFDQAHKLLQETEKSVDSLIAKMKEIEAESDADIAGNVWTHIPRTDERKGVFEKLVLALIVAVMIGGFAILSVHITRLDNKFDVLPDKINANLQSLTSMLSTAITASKQTPSQVIIIPEPKNQQPQAPDQP